MSAVQGLMRNLASDISVCYNQGAPHQIDMQEFTYFFDHDDYPSKRAVRFSERLDYGHAFEAKNDCGSKEYKVECENSLFDSDVVGSGSKGFAVAP